MDINTIIEDIKDLGVVFIKPLEFFPYINRCKDSTSRCIIRIIIAIISLYFLIVFWFFLLFFVVFTYPIKFILNRRKNKKSKEPEVEGYLFPIKTSPRLQAGEELLMTCFAIRYITKTRVVGRETSGSASGIRIGRVAFGGGGSSSRSIYGNITNNFLGDFILTNKRVIFASTQNSFEIKNDMISSIGEGDDYKVVITTPKENYVLHLISTISEKSLRRLRAGENEKLQIISDASIIVNNLIG